ncbi:unnamed protein product, partial [Ectocarpus sp. 8 AP-2014]
PTEKPSCRFLTKTPAHIAPFRLSLPPRKHQPRNVEGTEPGSDSDSPKPLLGPGAETEPLPPPLRPLDAGAAPAGTGPSVADDDGANPDAALPPLAAAAAAAAGRACFGLRSCPSTVVQA